MALEGSRLGVTAKAMALEGSRLGVTAKAMALEGKPVRRDGEGDGPRGEAGSA